MFASNVYWKLANKYLLKVGSVDDNEPDSVLSFLVSVCGGTIYSNKRKPLLGISSHNTPCSRSVLLDKLRNVSFTNMDEYH